MPPTADIGARVIAYLIDWVAPWVGWWIIEIILGSISSTLGFLFWFLGLIALFGYSIWNLIQEGNTGQTIGKKQQNIKLVGLENGCMPIGAGNAIVRALINGVVCGLGWLLPFVDNQKQTLGDKVTKSTVVPA